MSQSKRIAERYRRFADAGRSSGVERCCACRVDGLQHCRRGHGIVIRVTPVPSRNQMFATAQERRREYCYAR